MLTESKIKSAKPEKNRYQLRDANGLCVEVRPSGTKVFLKSYRFNGAQRRETLGEFPDVKLVDARARSSEISQMVKRKEDPRVGQQEPFGSAPTEVYADSSVPVERRFETVSHRYFEKRRKEGLSRATTIKMSRHIAFMNKQFERRDVASIRPPEILRVIEDIQDQDLYEKARDIFRKFRDVFAYAVALGLLEWNPAKMVEDAVVKKPRGKLSGETDPQKVGALMRAIRGYSGHTTRAALLVSAYTALRSSELRGGLWGEIDFDRRLWIVPGDRMKCSYGDHLVPLSQQVVTILEVLQTRCNAAEPDDLIFPSATHKGRPISSNTLNAALRRLGYDTRKEHCQHGFRITFSTNLNEMGWNRDWIERQLHHVDQDEVRGTYNKALYLNGRTEMMQSYADWLDAQEAAVS